MTFDAFQTTNGRPVEFLTFSNGTTNFRYTNASANVQRGADTYFSISYDRTEPTLSKDSDDSQITVTLPRVATVLGIWNGNFASNLTTLTIEKYHLNDPTLQIQVFFKGIVGSVSRQGKDSAILVTPLAQGKFDIPHDTFSGQCDSFLYDTPGCQVDRNLFKFDAPIGSIDVTGLQIGFTGLRTQAATINTARGGTQTSGELDLYWQAGYIKTAAGELREIMQGNVGGDPNVVRILQPFRAAAVGNTATVFAGCDKLFTTCNLKFLNAINFQGWPFIPIPNPTGSELPPGSRTSGGAFAGGP